MSFPICYQDYSYYSLNTEGIEEQPNRLYPFPSTEGYTDYQHVQNSQKPPLPKAVHSKTLALLDQAEKLAGSILNRSSSHQPPFNPELQEPQESLFPSVTRSGKPSPSVNIDFSSGSRSIFNSTTHVHQYGHRQSRQDREADDQTSRVMIGLIGFVVAAVTSFFIGKEMAEGEDLQEEVLNFQELKVSWNNEKSVYDNQYKDIVDEITKRVNAILQRKQANRTHKVALLIFGLIAGGTAFGGALAGSGAFMTAGIALGAGVSIAAFFKLGYNYFSNKDRIDAEIIDGFLSQLQQQQQPNPVDFNQ